MQECNQLNEMGLRHGYWEQYYENGELCYKGNYINGKKDGYWEWYNINGNLSHGNYKNNKRHGYWKEGWNGDNLLSNGNYVNGKRDGYWFINNQEYYYARM